MKQIQKRGREHGTRFICELLHSLYFRIGHVLVHTPAKTIKSASASETPRVFYRCPSWDIWNRPNVKVHSCRAYHHY